MPGTLLLNEPLPAGVVSAPRASWSAARWFLILSWTFGTLFAFLTPPFQVPDEYHHFYRSYQVSEGHLAQTIWHDQPGGFLPSSVIEFQDRVSQGIPHNPDKKQDFHTLLEMRKLPLNADQRQFVYFPWYSPTIYFPQAAAIAAARLFGAGPLTILYAGRLGNLLVWSLLIYLALRLMPMLDWTLLLLALTPMSLCQAASLSGDAMVNGLCFLFIATVLYLAVGDEKPIGARQLTAVLFLGAAIALAKTAYLPMTLLLLIVPARKFGGRRRKWLALAFFVAVTLSISVGWTLSTYHNFVLPGSSPIQQFASRLSHPLDAMRSYIGQLFSIPFLCSIIGKLGWYDTRLWRPSVIAYVVMLVLSTQIGGWPTVRLERWQKGIIALSAIVVWLAVFTLVDLAFTAVGAIGVTSLQGRYLIPATPLIALLFYPAPAARRREWGLPIVAFSACFCVFIAVVLVRRFYIS
jgi:uncharacterized membrane protein